MRRLLLASLLLTACQTLPKDPFDASPESQRGSVVVENHSFAAQRVRVYCDGVQVAVVRGLVTGKTFQKEFSSDCRGYVWVRAEFLGGSSWTSDRYSFPEGATVGLVLENHAPLSQVWIF